MWEMVNIYVRLINHYNHKHQTAFSAKFDKGDEDNQIMDESDFYINLSNLKSLTQSDIDNNRVRSQLKQQIHKNKQRIMVGDLLKWIQWQIF